MAHPARMPTMSAATRDPAPTTPALDAWSTIARLPAMPRGVLVVLAFERTPQTLTMAHWAALVGLDELTLATALSALADYKLLATTCDDRGLSIELLGPALDLARALRTPTSASAFPQRDGALFPTPSTALVTGMSIAPTPETSFLMRERARQAAYRQRVKARREAGKSAAGSAGSAFQSAFQSASERSGARSSSSPSSSSSRRSTTTTTTEGGAGGGGGGVKIEGEEAAASRRELKAAGVSSATVRAELAGRVPLEAVREEIARTKRSGGGAGAIVKNLRGYDPREERTAQRVDANEQTRRENAAAWQKRLSERVHELRVMARREPERFAWFVRAYAEHVGKMHKTRESAILDPAFVAFTIRQDAGSATHG